MTRKYLVEFTYQTGEVEEVETFDGTTTTTTTIPEENTGSTTTTSSTTSTTTTTSSTTTTTVPETWEQSTDIVIPEDELDIQGNEVKNNIDIINLFLDLDLKLLIVNEITDALFFGSPIRLIELFFFNLSIPYLKTSFSNSEILSKQSSSTYFLINSSLIVDAIILSFFSKIALDEGLSFISFE